MEPLVLALSIGIPLLVLILTLSLVFFLRRRSAQSHSRHNHPLSTSSKDHPIDLSETTKKLSSSNLPAAPRYVQLADERANSFDSSYGQATDPNHAQPHHPAVPSFLSEGDVLPAYPVVKAFEPKRRDDMRLRVGEVVTISMTFTDGVCHGYNHTTKAMGMFPISSVAVLGGRDNVQTHPIPHHEQPGSTLERTNSQHTLVTVPDADVEQGEVKGTAPKQGLQYCMVPPAQALELVAASLSADRRAHYFQALLRDTLATPHPATPADDTSTSPLEQQLRAAVEGAAGNESRATAAWRTLRVRWKDAVKADLDVGYDEWLKKKEKFDIWSLVAENYGTPGWN
ncbi:hypothetical protein HKX48_005925 [Thoreauomyces humboldtii]|nr:hypothetical protein HKX48_005925 [Thoreauomyces humboldtii]